MATIYNIAEALGVSTATVSRALNNSQLVNSSVREMVQSKARELGYKQRKIRRQRERLIVTLKLVFPETADPMHTLFYSMTDLTEGLKMGLAPSPANIICDVGATPESLFANKKSGSIDCVVFAFHEPSPEMVKAVKEQGVPSVVLNRSVPGLTSIGEDAVSGMKKLIQQVRLQDTKRRIVFVGNQSLGRINDLRSSAFISACEELGEVINEERNFWISPNFDSITCEQLRAFSSEPTAFLCANDLLASVVISELQNGGLSVPEDFWVAGFGGSPLVGVTRPRLTSLRMPARRIAKEAGAQLLKRVLDHEFMPMNLHIAGEVTAGGSMPTVVIS